MPTQECRTSNWDLFLRLAVIAPSEILSLYYVHQHQEHVSAARLDPKIPHPQNWLLLASRAGQIPCLKFLEGQKRGCEATSSTYCGVWILKVWSFGHRNIFVSSYWPFWKLAQFGGHPNFIPEGTGAALAIILLVKSDVNGVHRAEDSNWATKNVGRPLDIFDKWEFQSWRPCQFFLGDKKNQHYAVPWVFSGVWTLFLGPKGSRNICFPVSRAKRFEKRMFFPKLQDWKVRQFRALSKVTQGRIRRSGIEPCLLHTCGTMLYTFSISCKLFRRRSEPMRNAVK